MLAAVPDLVVSHGMIYFGHSGQRTSVKCAEAVWNNKARGVVHLQSPAFFSLYTIKRIKLSVFILRLIYKVTFSQKFISHSLNLFIDRCTVKQAKKKFLTYP